MTNHTNDMTAIPGNRERTVVSGPVETRILSRIKEENGCWVWQGHISSDGYGRVYWNERQWLAHRAAYTLWAGPVAEGLELDHLCRNRQCVNPEHLEPVTHSENMMRSPIMGRAQLEKTHCPKGHPYSEENTMRRDGKRYCRTCERARWDVDRYNPKEPCTACGKVMRRGNIARHQREACGNGRQQK